MNFRESGDCGCGCGGKCSDVKQKLIGSVFVAGVVSGARALRSGRPLFAGDNLREMLYISAGLFAVTYITPKITNGDLFPKGA